MYTKGSPHTNKRIWIRVLTVLIIMAVFVMVAFTDVISGYDISTKKANGIEDFNDVKASVEAADCVSTTSVLDSEGVEAVEIDRASSQDEDIAATAADDEGDSDSGSQETVAVADDADTVAQAIKEAVPDEELADHEEDVVLVSVPENTTKSEFQEILASTDYVDTTAVSDEELAMGLVALPLTGDLTVSQAATALEYVPGIDGAQPNYIYTVDDVITVDEQQSEAADGAGDAISTSDDAATDTADDVETTTTTDTSIEAEVPVTEVEYSDAAETEASDDFETTDTEVEADKNQTGELVGSDEASDGITDTAEEADGGIEAEASDEDDESLGLTALSTSIDDPYASLQWALGSIDVYDAWDSVKCNKAVGVAVIDTGADIDHPDLKDNIIATYNSVSYSTSASQAQDHNGHGSHTAGIIAAETNNDIGVSGVTYNAGLIVIKASGYANDTGIEFSTTSIVYAYQWLLSSYSSSETVAEHYNVRVINMSIGGVGESANDNAIHNEIESAYSAGILTVCAAGNTSWFLSAPYTCYPSDYSVVLSVMNLNSSGKLDSSSNYNTSGSTAKNICAPGTNIYSTLSDDNYGYMTGTSMASPCVAGVAALVIANNPDLTPADVTSILENTATDLGEKGWDEKYGYGEVNAQAAIENATSTITQTDIASEISASVSGNSVVHIGAATSYSVSTSSKWSGLSWTWFVSNTEVATIGSTSGVLTGVSEGSVTVTATCVAVPTISVSKKVIITDKAISISGATIKVADQAYTGSSLTPSVSVSLDGITLEEETDYTLSYTNNMWPGEASVTITGKNYYTGSITQTFTISSSLAAEALTSGAYVIYNAGSGMALGITGCSKASKANVRQYTANNKVSQRWRFVAAEDGHYQIYNIYSGKVLAVKGSSTKNSANVWQYSSNGKDAQLWDICENDDGTWTLFNVCSGKVLDIKGASKLSGANVQQYKRNGSTAQKFNLTKQTKVKKSGTYTIVSRLNTSYVMAVKNNSKAKKAAIQLYESLSIKAQRWKLTYESSSGYYVITNARSSKAVHVVAASTKNGAKIQQYNKISSWAERWALVKNSDGSYTLINALSGKALTVSGSKAKNGVRLIQRSSKGTKAQKWSLEAV